MSLRFRTSLPPLAFAAILAFAAAPARAQAPNAAAQAHVVQQLLHRNAARIQHQLHYIHAQDYINTIFQRIRPGPPSRDRQICAALDVVINRFNQLLNPAKLKLITSLAQLAQAINQLSKMAPPGSALAAYVKQAEQTFAQQLQQSQQIIERPPATPNCPSSLEGGGGTAGAATVAAARSAATTFARTTTAATTRTTAPPRRITRFSPGVFVRRTVPVRTHPVRTYRRVPASRGDDDDDRR